MAEVRCPKCNNLNPEEITTCRYCGAKIKSSGKGILRPGSEPVKKVTSELERVSTPSDKQAIKPGEFPTKKDTGELERALPTWLQSVRKGETSEEAKSDSAADQPEASSTNAEGGEKLPDWLAGLKENKEESEEIPEWLAGIRSKIGTEKIEPAEEAAPEAELPAEETTKVELPAEETSSEPQAEEVPVQSGEPAAEAEALPAAELPDWLSELKEKAEATRSEEFSALKEGTEEPAQDLSNWLNGLSSEKAGEETPTAAATPTDPDWLSRLKEETSETTSNAETPGTEMPDWLSGIPVEPIAPAEESEPTAVPAEMPDWLDQIQANAGSADQESPAAPFKTEPAPTSGDETPDWLSKLQAEAEKGTSGSGDEIPAESLQAWLSNTKDQGEGTAGTPALIQSGDADISQGETEGVFSMEDQPDWLSSLKPEEGKQADTLEGGEDELADSLEKAELPSWVQAMRPVESVVAEAEKTLPEAEQKTEQRGPLAGLRGVLPAVAGLGTLRKPPAYSIKLQVGDSQQQHASRLERIVSNESEPQALKNQARLNSARILRWGISLIFLLIIGVTIASGLQLVPDGAVYPPEMISAMNIIGGLPSNSPVLVVFDYQPAFSGEMEAASAPMIDHLLFSGARLTFLSTSPTGPALAERFLHDTQAEHNYQSGQQYVNLGYLSGGPAGMLDFAQNPSKAIPYDIEGNAAWDLPPLQDVREFNDFGTVIILTDDADTGRTWIEQTGELLGETPLLMVISAQAEPMIRPYYDSGQIKGLITGLAGGKAYGYFTQLSGPGDNYWNAFSIGMLAAEIMIVIGAIWSAIITWRERRPGEEGKASK